MNRPRHKIGREMATRAQTFLDYEGFCEKFKPRKTTDDCYTPANVYEAVKAWAVKLKE